MLNELEVPEDGFELLLDVIELIGYNDFTIKLINKNLPKTYDLSKFPKKLLKEMIKMTRSCEIISGSSDNSIKIWDINAMKTMITLNGHNASIMGICCS